MRLPYITVKVMSVSREFDMSKKVEVKFRMVMRTTDLEIVSDVREIVPASIANEYIVGEEWEAHFRLVAIEDVPK